MITTKFFPKTMTMSQKLLLSKSEMIRNETSLTEVSKIAEKKNNQICLGFPLVLVLEPSQVHCFFLQLLQLQPPQQRQLKDQMQIRRWFNLQIVQWFNHRIVQMFNPHKKTMYKTNNFQSKYPKYCLQFLTNGCFQCICEPTRLWYFRRSNHQNCRG